MSRRENMYENKVNTAHKVNLNPNMAEYHNNSTFVKTSSCVFSSKTYDLSDRLRSEEKRHKPRKSGIARGLTDFGMTLYRGYTSFIDAYVKGEHNN